MNMSKRRSLILYPFSLVYGIITGFRNFLYDYALIKATEFDVPIICVGNITVGGTGKTPHTEYLARLLSEGYRVAVLSRGYGRKTSDFRIVEKTSAVSETGDEPLQMKLNLGEITVAVDRNRVKGVRRLMEADPSIDVILLDDAYQHRRISPGFNILLTSYDNLITTDRILPWGNLRESAKGMRRADIILVTKSPSDLSAIDRRLIVKEINKNPGQYLYFTTIDYGEPCRVFSESGDDDNAAVQPGSPVLLVTGVANPEPLTGYIAQRYRLSGEMHFPDHHRFTKKDIDNVFKAYDSIPGDAKYIFTTQKDAVRIREFANIADPYREAFRYVPIGISFLNDDREEFENIIKEYVGKNKRNNRVSPGKGH